MFIVSFHSQEADTNFPHFRDEELKTLNGHESTQSPLTTQWWDLDL